MNRRILIALGVIALIIAFESISALLSPARPEPTPETVEIIQPETMTSEAIVAESATPNNPPTETSVPLPTLAPTLPPETDEPTITPTQTTLPPTATATLAPLVEASNTPAPTIAIVVATNARPTLPPEWTATPSITPTLPPTLESVGQVAKATLAVCDVFAVDKEHSQAVFRIGQAPQVFWTSVAGASRYRITLFNKNLQVIFSDYAINITYAFRSDLFESNQNYGWEVYPEDALNVQMCYARGGELIPQ